MPPRRTARKKAPRAKNKPTRTRSTSKRLTSSTPTDGKKDSCCPIVGIGGSAGGDEAASELLKNLPPKSGMAFVVVQHLDPHHASNLPKLLGKVTQMPVNEISGRIKPEPNTVYVLPPNKGLICEKGALTLIRRTERPTLAIDRFFESL